MSLNIYNKRYQIKRACTHFLKIFFVIIFFADYGFSTGIDDELQQSEVLKTKPKNRPSYENILRNNAYNFQNKFYKNSFKPYTHVRFFYASKFPINSKSTALKAAEVFANIAWEQASKKMQKGLLTIICGPEFALNVNENASKPFSQEERDIFNNKMKEALKVFPKGFIFSPGTGVYDTGKLSNDGKNILVNEAFLAFSRGTFDNENVEHYTFSKLNESKIDRMPENSILEGTGPRRLVFTDPEDGKTHSIDTFICLDSKDHQSVEKLGPKAPDLLLKLSSGDPIGGNPDNLSEKYKNEYTITLVSDGLMQGDEQSGFDNPSSGTIDLSNIYKFDKNRKLEFVRYAFGFNSWITQLLEGFYHKLEAKEISPGSIIPLSSNLSREDVVEGNYFLDGKHSTLEDQERIESEQRERERERK